MVYSICLYFSVWIFGIAESGIAHGSPPGTTTEVQRVRILSAENRFVSRGLLRRRPRQKSGGRPHIFRWQLRQQLQWRLWQQLWWWFLWDMGTPGSPPTRLTAVPDKWVRPTRRLADLSVGPTDLDVNPHDLLKTFQKNSQMTQSITTSRLGVQDKTLVDFAQSRSTGYGKMCNVDLGLPVITDEESGNRPHPLVNIRRARGPLYHPTNPQAIYTDNWT
jgi:hypothetical protein